MLVKERTAWAAVKFIEAVILQLFFLSVDLIEKMAVALSPDQELVSKLKNSICNTKQKLHLFALLVDRSPYHIIFKRTKRFLSYLM